jgi:hypothetical protein
MKNVRTTLCAAAVVAIGGVLLSGCNTGATDGYKYGPPMTESTAAQKIQAVQDNPHMPPGAKAMAIASIKNSLAHNANPSPTGQ